jgi:DNA-binding NarL/FixJ family response regulator
MKVLIADGSREVADRLLNLIQEIPAAEMLCPTATASATLEAVRAHDPGILIVDARLPGAQGTLLPKTLREEKPTMILIVLSNLIYPEYRQQYEAAGADLIVDKSNEFIHLRQIIRGLIGHS